MKVPESSAAANACRAAGGSLAMARLSDETRSDEMEEPRHAGVDGVALHDEREGGDFGDDEAGNQNQQRPGGEAVRNKPSHATSTSGVNM